MNTITIISNLINEGLLRLGAVEAVEVPEPLWEKAMDEVADAGGEVGLDYCVVDGVKVRLATEDIGDATAVFLTPGSTERRPLSMSDES